MEKHEAVQAFVDSINRNDNDLFFPLLAEDCVYWSRGKERANGKEAVCRTLTSISEYWAGRYRHAWFAEITQSIAYGFEDGEPCAVMAMTDEYCCAGFFTMKLNGEGKVVSLLFSVDPDVRFSISGEEETDFCHEHFPYDSYDAVMIRAEGKGIIGKEPPGLHFRDTGLGREFSERLMLFISENVFGEFANKLVYSAGYMFAAGMAADFYQRTGVILFRFNEGAADEGSCPIVPKEYREWIREGLKMGRDLFTAFDEYRHNLNDDTFDLRFDDELMLTYNAIFDAGSIKADRDLDNDRPVSLMREDALVSAISKHAIEAGYINDRKEMIYIYDVLNASSTFSREMFRKMSEYGEEHNYTMRLIVLNTLCFCAYTGIGAVLLWKENGEKLPYGNIVEMLCEPRGLYYMDEYVHDMLGMPFESEEAKDFVAHIYESRNILADILEHKGFEPIIMNEAFKAMYDYGMIWAMDYLGIEAHPRVFPA